MRFVLQMLSVVIVVAAMPRGLFVEVRNAFARAHTVPAIAAASQTRQGDDLQIR